MHSLGGIVLLYRHYLSSIPNVKPRSLASVKCSFSTPYLVGAN